MGRRMLKARAMLSSWPMISAPSVSTTCPRLRLPACIRASFREDMFEEAEGLEHPYFRTKHDSEAIVRKECNIPWRVYRPGMVVGHSETGEMDKVDGPYYFFKGIQKMRNLLPPWMPTLGIEGSRINIVPVDYVAKATLHIAHKPRLDGRAFHLTESKPTRIGEILNIFAKAAHAPQMSMRIDARMFSYVPATLRQGLSMLPPVRRIINEVLTDLGLPADIFKFVNYPTRFDNRDTVQALKGTGISVPDLEDYAWRLWDYWERHLDPDLFIDRSLRGHVGGQGGGGDRRLIRHRQSQRADDGPGRRARDARGAQP